MIFLSLPLTPSVPNAHIKRNLCFCVVTRYFTAILNDTTQKKKVAEKNKFLAFLSHEIRNPLQVIIAGLQLLAIELTNEDKEKRPPQADAVNETNSIQEVIDTTSKAAEILYCVVNDIVDLTKIETQKFVLEKRVFDVEKTLNSCFEMVKKTKWFKRTISMDYEIDSSTPKRAIADSRRIEQIVLNLLSNALKYTNEGQVVMRCRSIRKEDKDMLQISVEDTGIGISEEDQKKLFVVYTHIEDPTQRCSEKTGNTFQF